MIDDIIRREDATLSGKVTVDAGGRTQYGIAEKYNPEAWADGKVTLDEARSIFRYKYLEAPGFDSLKDQALKDQLFDFGVNSGPALAIQKLQGILGVDVDGRLGPKTLAAIDTYDPRDLNNKLAIARVIMIGRLTQRRPSDLKHLGGWLIRATSFIR